MKRIWFKRSLWQSVLSLVVMGVFAYMAIGSFGGTSQQKKELGDGVYELSKIFSGGKQEVTTGRTDGNNNWHGPVKIEYLDEDGNFRSMENVEMVNGLRHGESTITYTNGAVKVYCYEMGKRVECDKSAIITENSAYEILNYKYPWFTAKLNAFDYTDEYIKAFMDTFEILIGENEFDITEFDSQYNDANDILEETYFDSILILNAQLSIYNGSELINFEEFRLAAIDQHRSTDHSIFNTIKLKYPNYLAKLTDFEITESDFQAFGNQFDSLMQSYGPLEIDNPFFVDSIDIRMFRAILFMASEDNSLVTGQSLKSLAISNGKPDFQQLLKIADPILQKAQSDKNPKEVATVVAAIILVKFVEGDLVKRSLYESFSLKKGVVNFATVTTGFLGRNSNSSVTLKGNIISDGGGTIITNGFYYGIVYNPDSTNFSVAVKGGTENFEAAINELSEGVTYYARAFAKNSAGIAYGNCISFTTNTVVGSENNELNEMVFDVFPNPTGGLTTFRFNIGTPDNAILTISNMNGQMVLQKEFINLSQGENNVQLNLSNLENGIYSCRLIFNNTTSAKSKFIIAR